MTLQDGGLARAKTLRRFPEKKYERASRVNVNTLDIGPRFYHHLVMLRRPFTLIINIKDRKKKKEEERENGQINKIGHGQLQ